MDNRELDMYKLEEAISALLENKTDKADCPNAEDFKEYGEKIP